MKIDLKELVSEFNSNLKLDYDLKKKNWFNIGGKTKAFYKADNLKELIKFLKKIHDKEKIFILGAGSNTLISDNKFDGVVIKLAKNFNNISDKVLSDFIEAILGSLYIDSGIETVRNLIVELWMEEIKKNKDLRRDAKSILQEWTQANGLGLPVYKVLKKKGLDHQPTFEIELKVKNFDVILGNGNSLQIAQKKTAEKFIKKFIEEDIIVR